MEAALLVSIAVIVVPLLIGCMGTVVGMIEAFQTLDETGESDPSALAENVSTSIIATAAGLVVSAVVGLPLFIFSLVKILRTQDG